MHRGLHDLVMASPVVWEAEAAEGALPLLWPHRRLLAVSRGKDMLPLRCATTTHGGLCDALTCCSGPCCSPSSSRTKFR